MTKSLTKVQVDVRVFLEVFSIEDWCIRCRGVRGVWRKLIAFWI